MRSFRLIYPILALTAGCLISHETRAAVVANYQFTGNSLASTDTDVSSVAGDFVIGGGLSGSTAFTTFGSGAPALVAGTDATSDTDANAFALDDYISITLTPIGGVSLAYTSLVFDAKVYTFSSTTTGTVAVRSSLNGFAFTLDSRTITATSGSITTGGRSVTLSAFASQSGPVEFRFYFYDDQNASVATAGVGVDNVSINATVVPEPSAVILTLIGAVSFLAFSRAPAGEQRSSNA